VRGQRHAPADFYPRERPCTDCTESLVGPRASLDRCGKSRPHQDSIPRSPILWSVAIPTELPGPRNVELFLWKLNLFLFRPCPLLVCAPLSLIPCTCITDFLIPLRCIHPTFDMLSSTSFYIKMEVKPAPEIMYIFFIHAQSLMCLMIFNKVFIPLTRLAIYKFLLLKMHKCVHSIIMPFSVALHSCTEVTHTFLQPE
jgi:hypothetical protein